MEKTLELKRVEPALLGAILDCYRNLSSRDRHMMLADATWLKGKAHSGQAVVAMKAGKVFAFAAWDDVQPGRLIETRTCFVSPEARGLGLQRILHGARSALACHEHGKAVAAVSAVKPGNGATVRNLEKLGFRRWRWPTKALFEPCSACPQRLSQPWTCCCLFYLCTSRRYLELGASYGRLAREDNCNINIVDATP